MSSLVRSLANDVDLLSILTPFTYDTPSSRWSSSSSPAANVIEGDTSYIIEMAVPGLSRSDFKVVTEGSRLTISGEVPERHFQSKDKDKERSAYIRQEFGFNREFSRTWILPSHADARGITARYDAGILTVEVPVESRKGRFEVRIE